MKPGRSIASEYIAGDSPETNFFNRTRLPVCDQGLRGYRLRMSTVVFLKVSTMLSGGARGSRDNVSVLPIGLSKGIMGRGSTNCCISPGQHYAFRGSTGVPRQCLRAPDWLEQRYNGPRKYEPCTRFSSMDQGAFGDDETGMLFSAANLSRSCRPRNLSQNSDSRHGAMT